MARAIAPLIAMIVLPIFFGIVYSFAVGKLVLPGLNSASIENALLVAIPVALVAFVVRKSFKR